jgi:hypothetical protein
VSELKEQLATSAARCQELESARVVQLAAAKEELATACYRCRELEAIMADRASE